VSYSLDINDLHDIRLIRSVLLVAMDANNLITSLNHVVFLGHTDDHLDHIVSANVRVNLVAPDATNDLELLDDLIIARAGKNGHGGTVLGHETAHRASVSDNNH
jgi:hypothetical protein